MKVIIAGSRTITDPKAVEQAIEESGFHITRVLCGGAKGVDKLGSDWADDNLVPVDMYPANWNEHGRSAGYKRNIHMANHADALIAVWDGKSNGTRHMIEVAQAKGKKVYVKAPAGAVIPQKPEVISTIDDFHKYIDGNYEYPDEEL